jgi:putative nucleotidyltransferase with HDIG domain
MYRATLREQDLFAETLERDRTPLGSRERAAEGLIAGAFVVVTGVLFLAQPPQPFPLLPAAACIVVLALATRVRFHIASGFTVPTQLAFVPLVFTVPIAVAPPAVLLSLILSRLPDVLRRRTRSGRLLCCFGNSWFAVGPAAVFGASGTDPSQAGPVLLLLALAAQLVLDFSVSSIRNAIESKMPLREQGREAWIYAVDAALSPVALAVAYEIDSRPALVLGLVPMLGVLAVFARERQARLEGIIELKNAYHGTALVLGDVIKADDGYTGAHSKGVVQLTLAVADQLGLDPERRRNLEFGALLHDVGKVAIPKEIINKPGRLEPEEWRIIKAHTVQGQRMLERVGGFMREVGIIVRHHHERWDGSGYPDQLAGEAIPVESRIITCCDAWNAMRTDRPYRKAMSYDAAVQQLLGNAGKQFDPRIVDGLLAVLTGEESRQGDDLDQRSQEAFQPERGAAGLANAGRERASASRVPV